MIFFLTQQLKHVFWVFKRTVSSRPFFWVLTKYWLRNKKNNFQVSIRKSGLKLWFFSYPAVETCFVGVQKNHRIETVLLSTHNICFYRGIRIIFFNYIRRTLDIKKSNQTNKRVMELENVAGLRMNFSLITPDRRQSKTLILSTNDQKIVRNSFWLPWAFLIAALFGVLMHFLTADPGIWLVYSNRKINCDQ